MIKVRYSEFVADLAKQRAKLPSAILEAKIQSTNKPRTASKKALLEKIEQGAKRTGIDWTRKN